MTRLRLALLSSAVALVGVAGTLAAPAAVPAAPPAPPSVAGSPGPDAGTAEGRPAPRARRVGSLRLSESRYVGGQSLVWSGNIGARGVRRIRLQLNVNRAGDQWTPVPGFSARTERTGSFRFRFPAAGSTVRYRVVSGRLVTRSVLFAPKSQDLTLAVVGGDVDGLYGRVDPGVPFTLAVDTTPTLFRRDDTRGLPALPGRVVTLQRRVGTGWSTVGRTTTDARGRARFADLTVADPTLVVLRVRQEDYRRNGSRIGWFPSFPYYLYVGQDPPPRSGGREVDAGGGEAGGASATAATRYGWKGIGYDFGWIRGESLTSAPQRGSQRRAALLDTSDGSGRASIRNGGLELISSRVNAAGPGDFGSTYVTVQRASQKYGRWELRMRSKVLEAGQGDYRMVAQLVPAADPDDCSRTITVARVDQDGTRLTIGANAGRTAWRASRAIRSLGTSSPAFAVEVTPTHVTWLMDGTVIGVVRSRSVSSDRAMTLRVGLVGTGETEMNHTTLFHDWVRSFPLGTGRQVTRGPALPSTGDTLGC